MIWLMQSADNTNLKDIINIRISPRKKWITLKTEIKKLNSSKWKFMNLRPSNKNFCYILGDYQLEMTWED